jgi:hypothetical protein
VIQDVLRVFRKYVVHHALSPPVFELGHKRCHAIRACAARPFYEYKAPYLYEAACI